MGKNKKKKFAELESFENVFQPVLSDLLKGAYYLKGKWSRDHFRNDHKVILELGCGKGEYTVSMAEKYPSMNFIGMDIKGARLWTGARYAKEHHLRNVLFIRARIEFISSFFSENEISEIWLTFPDPQSKRRRNKKRLTGSLYLDMYRKFLQKEGVIHLKTDNKELFEYSRSLIVHNKFRIVQETDDLYNSDIPGVAREIKTFYENQFLEKGMKICYLAFSLNHGKKIEEPAGGNQ